MSGYLDDAFLEIFLNLMFDEGEDIRYETDPDIVEVQPVSYSRGEESETEHLHQRAPDDRHLPGGGPGPGVHI